MNERVPITEISERLGMKKQAIRDALKDKSFPVGFAIRNRSGEYTYVVPRQAFERMMGTIPDKQSTEPSQNSNASMLPH